MKEMTTKKLIDLETHNKHKVSLYNTDNAPALNGIACPNCGQELYDSSPNIKLTSNPPQKHIHCESCDYKGYRIA